MGMTKLEKIEILEKIKDRLQYDTDNTICYLFWLYSNGKYCFVRGHFVNWRGFAYRHLGDVFKKHKPQNKRLNEQWFEYGFSGAVNRITVINKMIEELRKLP